MPMTKTVFYLGALLFIVGGFGFIFLTDSDYDAKAELRKSEGIIEKVDISQKNVVSIHLRSDHGNDVFVQRQCGEDIYGKLRGNSGSLISVLHDDGSALYLGGRKRFWRATTVAGSADLFDYERLRTELDGKNARTRSIALIITVTGLGILITSLLFMLFIKKKRA